MNRQLVRKTTAGLLAVLLLAGLFAVIPPQLAEAGSQDLTTRLAGAATDLNGTIDELDKANIERGDLIYFGNLNGLPLNWHVVIGAGNLAAITLLPDRKAGEPIPFDSDPDGAGPLVPSNNYRDADIRSYLNTTFIATLSRYERGALQKMRAYDSVSGIAVGNPAEDPVNGDFAYLPNDSEIVNWGMSFPSTRTYWANYWSRSPVPILPAIEHIIQAGSSSYLEVFVGLSYAPRPVIVAATAKIAAIFPVVSDNTGKPWALEADSTQYVLGTDGRTYVLGLLAADELTLTGVPVDPQTSEGSLLLDPLIPSVNDGTAVVKFLIYDKNTGSILKYSSVAADELTRLTLDLSGLAAGGDYVVRIWLQRDEVPLSGGNGGLLATSSEMSAYYEFDLTIGAEPTPTATPTATPAATPAASPTAAPLPDPTATPAATPSPDPTATPTVRLTQSPSATPEITPAATDDRDEIPKTGEQPNQPVEAILLIVCAAVLLLVLRLRHTARNTAD